MGMRDAKPSRISARACIGNARRRTLQTVGLLQIMQKMQKNTHQIIPFRQLTDCLFRYKIQPLIDWLRTWSTDCFLLDWLIDWLIIWLIDWVLIDWLIDCMINRLSFDWLIDYIIKRIQFGFFWKKIRESEAQTHLSPEVVATSDVMSSDRKSRCVSASNSTEYFPVSKSWMIEPCKNKKPFFLKIIYRKKHNLTISSTQYKTEKERQMPGRENIIHQGRHEMYRGRERPKDPHREDKTCIWLAKHENIQRQPPFT